MSAFDYLISQNTPETIQGYRRTLVNNRGTLANGNMAVGMALQYDRNKMQPLAVQDAVADQDNLLPDATSKKPLKIFQLVGKAQHPGLIFDREGTDIVLTGIITTGNVRLNETLITKLLFVAPKDTDNWQECSQPVRRSCVARNLDDMYRKTDVIYRTNGDRMHYLVNSLVSVTDSRGNVKRFPLFLFSCTDINRNTLTATVEQTGFINFWLDSYVLEETIAKTLGSIEVSLDGTFNARCNEIVSMLSKLQLSDVQKIEIDPTYTALSIITGFEAEYIDHAWKKILEPVLS